MLKSTLATLWMFTLVAAPLASFSPSAEAGCEASAQTLLDRVEVQEGEQAIDAEGDVSVNMSDGSQKNLGSSSEAAQPRENWMGTPPSDEAAKEALTAAIKLAQDGKEEECQEMLADVRNLLGIEKPEEKDADASPATTGSTTN